MRKDIYGQVILDENDLCELYLKNSDYKLKHALVDKNISFPEVLEIAYPVLKVLNSSDLSIDEFDNRNQNNWLMPEFYKTFDIAKFVLDQCKSEPELQRAGEELIKYQERDMFDLLRYLKYLVDTMRDNNIVWGVGRGSSVASFVLFLIGVHRINSLHYDLSIDEFLK